VSGMKQVGFLTPLARAFRWHRRWFAAIFAALAVLAGLNAVNATSTELREVVVASRQLSGGATLTASDLEVVRLPPQAVPDGALTEVSMAVGKTTRSAIPGRRALVPGDFLGGSGSLGPGRMALPVEFDQNQAIGLLSSGVRIDVLGPQAGSGGYQVVAAEVRVVTALSDAGSSGPFGAAQAGPVLLDVDSAQASAILAAASIGSISFALR
jgi:pilus assembly protein CpaB